MTKDSSGSRGLLSLKITLSTKEGAAKLPIVGVSIMLVMKIVAAVVTGSISIRADAIHSLLDLVSAIIGFVAIKIAGRPPDEGHRYGHGRAEDLAGLIIGAMILAVAGTIIYEAIMRIIAGGVVTMLAVGIWITAVAIVINIVVSWWVMRIAQKTDSVALLAEGKHLRADILSSVAVLLGLVIIQFTGILILDSIIAIIIGLIIAKESYQPLKTALDHVMDKRLPDAEEEAIISVVNSFGDRIVGMNELRTRKSGSLRFVEIDIIMPRHASVSESHCVCHQLTKQLSQVLDAVTVNTHILPCVTEGTSRKAEADCSRCLVSCTLRGQGRPKY